MKIYRTGPETERLQHRALTVDDAAIALELNRDPKINRYTGETLWTSLEEATRKVRDYPDFDEVGYGRWGCVFKETQRIIGFCGLKFLSDVNEVDIGFRFLPQFWGQGLATEAATACLNFGFETIGLAQIAAFVMPDNLASVRVLEKIGMTFANEIDLDGIHAHRFIKNA